MKSLTVKIVAVPVSMLIFIVLASFIALIPYIHDGLIESRKQSLEFLISVAYGIVEQYAERAESGELSPAAAREQAAELLRTVRYGNNDYFWINNAERPFPSMIMHPTAPQLEGVPMDSETFNRASYIQTFGSDERTVFRDHDENLGIAILAAVEETGYGYVGYDWPKPLEGGGVTDVAVPKESLVHLFEPWGWILGTGVYVDDIEAQTSLVSRTMTGVLGGIAVVMVLLSIFLAQIITRPIRGATAQLRVVASGGGDLTARLPVRSRDEVGDLADSFNEFAEGLCGLIGGIRGATEHLRGIGNDLSANMEETSSAVHQIMANIAAIKKQNTRQNSSVGKVSETLGEVDYAIGELKDRMTEQAAAVEQSAAAVEQMVASIRSVSQRLESNTEEIESLIRASDEGKRKLGQVAELVIIIDEMSQGLLTINDTIKTVSARTNLLAMNASIEAAHAGEFGIGFAVVAEEIRRLSEQSAKQSRESNEVVSSMKNAIDSVSEASGDSERAFKKVVIRINEIADKEREIRDAMEEQTTGSTEVLDALQRMKSITGILRDESERVKQSKNRIADEVKQLVDMSQQVSESMEEINVGSGEINSAVTHVAEISVSNRDNINTVRGLVDRFKIE
ncbi:MAG: methyl-accepting chemotaxis protein [Spirochaetales bacterium]|nr:methyl-accepting chemotaxis protein [Spirochaetales bacterium]